MIRACFAEIFPPGEGFSSPMTPAIVKAFDKFFLLLLSCESGQIS